MDPLPLSINQHQLQLLHKQMNQTIEQLQSAHEAGEFSNGNGPNHEQNLETYGTDNYEEAHALVKAIDDALESHLQSWNESPETAKPVAIALNSYQIKVLRNSIERGMHGEAGKALEDVIEQLPEESPQEDAD